MKSPTDNLTINPDDDAVLDYVSRVAETLADPVEPISEDRERAGELRDLRGRVAGLKIPPPHLGATWGDVMERRRTMPKPRTGNRYRPQTGGSRMNRFFLSKWGVAVSVAASLFLAMALVPLTMGNFSEDQYVVEFHGNEIRQKIAPSQGSSGASTGGRELIPLKSQLDPPLIPPPPEVKFPKIAKVASIATGTNFGEIECNSSGAAGAVSDSPVFDTIIREGSISLLHEDPADLEQRIISLAEDSGGMVKYSERRGIKLETRVTIVISVPSEKFRSVLSTISGMGEVLAKTEETADAAANLVNYESLLAESQDYLRQLDELAAKEGTQTEARKLLQDRRTTRQTIERYQGSLNQLKSRISMSTLRIDVSAKEPEKVKKPEEPKISVFTEAWNDGSAALSAVLAFFIRAGLATLPLIFLLVGLVFYMRGRARRAVAED